MTNWKEYILGEVAEFIDYKGKTPNKKDKGIPLITAKIVKNGTIQQPTEFISIEDYPKWMVRGFPEIGDVVLTTEAPLGEVALIKDKNVALAQRIITIRGSKGVLDSGYLKYFLQSNIGQQRLKEKETGTTVMGIKSSELKLIKISCPTFEQQQQIAEILSSLDNKIELNNQINQNLETFTQALFKQWFVDFEFPNNKGNPYKSSGGKMVESEFGEIPQGWFFSKLEKHIKFVKGKKPKEVFNEQIDNLLPQILIETLDTGKSFFADPIKMVVSEETDLIMVMDGASSGRIETGFSGIIGSTLAIIKITKSINTFIYQFLKTKEKDIRDNTTGAAIPHTDKSKIYDFDIIIPIDETVKGFNIIVENIRKKIKSNKSENAKLVLLRDLILPKLMSGELEVKSVKYQLTT